MIEHEELKKEVLEIIKNARAARLLGLITREQEREATHIPRMDLLLTAQDLGKFRESMKELERITK